MTFNTSPCIQTRETPHPTHPISNTLSTQHHTRHIPPRLAVRYGRVRNYGTKFWGLKVRFEITVRYIFPGTVHFESTIFCSYFFSNLFRTNLIIERRPLRYVRNQDLYRFCHVSMKYSKLYRVLHIVQKKKRGPHPFPACLSSIGASYRRPSWRAGP